eukprot:1142458-Prorocentrum_minimum.AAC.1
MNTAAAAAVCPTPHTTESDHSLHCRFTCLHLHLLKSYCLRGLFSSVLCPSTIIPDCESGEWSA